MGIMLNLALGRRLACFIVGCASALAVFLHSDAWKITRPVQKRTYTGAAAAADVHFCMSKIGGIDCVRLASEMVRALRGKRSQQAFNRRLQFKTNVANSWERGKRQPSAAKFLRVAQLMGVDVRTRLRGFLQEPSSELAHKPFAQLVVALLQELRGTASYVSIAERLGRNRVSVARWLKGETEPRLPELLELVASLSPRLLEFVAVFCDPAQVPSVARAWADLAEQRRIAFEQPWSHALLRALELDAYRALPEHRPELLARAVGLSDELAAQLIEALIACGQVVSREGRLEVARVLAVDTGGRSQAADALKQHWAQAALERFASGRLGDGLFSFNLFTVSHGDYEAIRQLHLRYYHDLRLIVQNSTKNERVVLMNQQLIPLGA
jgi:transcriptional regulator with XRE-family HTH domain